MAGSNKTLQADQVLFRAGDKSDGMYLIRRGELRVYLEKDGKEVQLATIPAGGMIGEMALFDGAPRSASVKAVKECEVTIITNDDFGKLMKQIPKWFVGLMTALSTRLRQTNERLQKMESGGGGTKGKPYQNVVRALNIMLLLWHKDGEKDGKDTVLGKAKVEQALLDLFGEDPERVKLLFETLVKEKVLVTRTDQYKNVVFAKGPRVQLPLFTNFVMAWMKATPKYPCCSDDLLALLRTLEKIALASPYDAVTATIADIQKEGKRDGLKVDAWTEVINQLPPNAEEVKLVKASSGPGLKTTKKDISVFCRNHEVLAAIYKANLA